VAKQPGSDSVAGSNGAHKGYKANKKAEKLCETQRPIRAPLREPAPGFISR